MIPAYTASMSNQLWPAFFPESQPTQSLQNSETALEVLPLKSFINPAHKAGINESANGVWIFQHIKKVSRKHIFVKPLHLTVYEHILANIAQNEIQRYLLHQIRPFSEMKLG